MDLDGKLAGGKEDDCVGKGAGKGRGCAEGVYDRNEEGQGLTCAGF